MPKTGRAEIKKVRARKEEYNRSRNHEPTQDGGPHVVAPIHIPVRNFVHRRRNAAGDGPGLTIMGSRALLPREVADCDCD